MAPSKLCIAAGALAFGALVVMVALSPPYALYDEPYYVRYAQLIDRFGLGGEFLRHLPGTPGPLVAVVQYSFKDFTNLKPPAIRLVNTALMAAAIGVLYWMFRLVASPTPLSASLSVMAIPVVWPIAGLALSDMPAVFFICLSVVCLVRWMKTADDDQAGLLTWSALGGLALGIAAMGRQNSLALCAVPVLYATSHQRRIASAMVFVLLSVGLMLPIFWAWGGLAPPSPLHVSTGLSLPHALVSFAYAGLFLLLLAPGFLPWRAWWVAAALVIGLAVQMGTVGTSIAPLSSVTQRLMGRGFPVYRSTASILLLGFGCYFAVSLVYRLRENRANPMLWLGCTGTFWLALTAIAVKNNYSSRYTMPAMPLLLLIADCYGPPTRWKAVRIAAGSILGALSLWSYLQSQGWELDWRAIIDSAR